MAIRTRTDFKALYGSSGTVFADNTTGQISELDMRNFGEDQADSFNMVSETYDVYAISTLGTNTYTSTPAYTITSYGGKQFYVKFVNASTGAVTINIGSLGAKKVYKNPTTQADSGDIIANQIYDLVYDATLDAGNGGFQIVGSSTSTGGGNIEIVSVLPSVGDVISLPFGDEEETIFICTVDLSSAKSVDLLSDSNAKKFSFSFNVTNVAAVIEFPTEFIMNDVRWDSGTKEFTPDATGRFRGLAFFDGTNWLLDISGPYA